MKDKRNHHGAVGKSSSQQHFRKSASITFIVRNFWSPTPSATRSYGRQAGKQAGWLAGRRNTGEFRKLAIGRNIRLVTLFYQGTASLQPYQCIPTVFFR